MSRNADHINHTIILLNRFFVFDKNVVKRCLKSDELYRYKRNYQTSQH